MLLGLDDMVWNVSGPWGCAEVQGVPCEEFGIMPGIPG